MQTEEYFYLRQARFRVQRHTSRNTAARTPAVRKGGEDPKKHISDSSSQPALAGRGAVASRGPPRPAGGAAAARTASRAAGASGRRPGPAPTGAAPRPAPPTPPAAAPPVPAGRLSLGFPLLSALAPSPRRGAARVCRRNFGAGRTRAENQTRGRAPRRRRPVPSRRRALPARP